MEFRLPTREENSNKGTFGKILNISGSHYMSGAGYLSSVSALKVGAGFVTLASDEKVLDTVAKLAPEVVLAPLEKISEFIETSTVLLIGCGLSTDIKAQKIFHKVIPSNIPTVIDADGLNILSKTDLKLNKTTILTPHPKEASRLLGCSLDEVLNDMENSAKLICQKYNCITVLKSHRTIVTDNENIYFNTTGNSALAKAGSGDVLAGMISGFLAQGLNPFEASCLGVYLHGLAGDLAKNDLTAYGVLASDTIRYIPNAIKNLLLAQNE
jgi:NAD(P)H-hydrate epimerase